jgi:hypothetical protein
MKKIAGIAVLFAAGLAALIGGTCNRTEREFELRTYPIDNLDGLITRSHLEFDPTISVDGSGAAKFDVTSPTVFRLFEARDLNVEEARLIYRARIRTLELSGQAYLEMWCHFPGLGGYFSRGIQDSLTGTNEWSTEETIFLLQPGQNPDMIKLNLVVNGKGTVWVDQVQLLKGPHS